MNPHPQLTRTHARASTHKRARGARKWVEHGRLCVSVYMRVEGGTALRRYGGRRSCTVVFCCSARACVRGYMTGDHARIRSTRECARAYITSARVRLPTGHSSCECGAWGGGSGC